MNPIQKVLEEAGKKFDERFPNYDDIGGDFIGCYLSGGYCSTNAHDIKSFLSTHSRDLLRAVMETCKELEDRDGSPEGVGYNRALKELSTHLTNLIEGK